MVAPAVVLASMMIVGEVLTQCIPMYNYNKVDLFI